MLQIISVSALNSYIKSLFDSDDNLSCIFIEGEISNLSSHYRSGHIYFSLKDDKSTVRAVMFSSYASRLRFSLEEGMKVIARCRVSVYEATGQYQLYVEDIQPDGAGALSIAFEQLKNKLAAQGLFSDERKKKIPEYPEKIAVITSPTGAAVQDILNILGRRFPLAEIVMCPVTVQGDNASPELVNALNEVNEKQCADVIIIGRGGGSAEDLWAFNSEALAYAIAESQIPVISAVGHETDFTICDFVADLRAPTPSAAAELAVPDINELNSYILSIQNTLEHFMSIKLSNEYMMLDRLSELLNSFGTDKLTLQKLQKLDMLSAQLKSAFSSIMIEKENKLSVSFEKLQALSPLNVLARGYSILSKESKNITTVSQIDAGDTVAVRLSDGNAYCTVNNTERTV